MSKVTKKPSNFFSGPNLNFLFLFMAIIGPACVHIAETEWQRVLILIFQIAGQGLALVSLFQYRKHTEPEFEIPLPCPVCEGPAIKIQHIHAPGGEKCRAHVAQGKEQKALPVNS